MKVVAVADVSIPPPKGEESDKRWRGVLYDDDTTEYFEGDYFDLTRVDIVPEPVRICLDFLLAWRALDEPDELEKLP